MGKEASLNDSHTIIDSVKKVSEQSVGVNFKKSFK